MIGTSSFGSGARILAATALLLLAACGSDAPEYVERPPEELYNKALDELQFGSAADASAMFDEVERQHPYSQWSTRAQLMSAYSSYRALKYDEAIPAIDRFIELHPGNPDIPYAYYLRALCFYEQISDVRRDQGMTQQALIALEDVIKRYPDSRYARDAKLKADLARDHLAGKEMSVGRYYMRRGEYAAAIGRFTRVVTIFDTTTHVPEALHRLTESYLALGIEEEAKQTAAVLGYNYPGSDWYQDSYAILTGELPPGYEPEGFFTRAWNSIAGSE